MTDAKYDVLGIGNAIFDVFAQTDEKFLADHGIELAREIQNPFAEAAAA